MRSFSGHGVPVDPLYVVLDNMILRVFNNNLVKTCFVTFSDIAEKNNEYNKFYEQSSLQELAEKNDDYKKFVLFGSGPVTS